MLFKDKLPDRLFEQTHVSAFMDVLDSLQSFKETILSESLRVNNIGVLMEKKWLLKKLSEFGVTDIPLQYPIQIIRQYLLNVDTIFRIRGSKKGVELYCSLMSLGEVEIDDSQFYADPDTLLLDSRVHGYITEDTSTRPFYLCADSEVNKPVTLTITIKSKYFNGSYSAEENLIKSYIETTIGRYLGFSPNRRVSFIYQSREEFYFHDLLNSYFV